MSQWLKNLLGKAKNWLGPQQQTIQAQPDGEWAIEQDHFDHRTFRELLDEVPAIEDMVNQLSQEHDYSENLVGDLFAEFFKGDPELTSKESMRPEFLHNWTVTDQVRKDPETDRLRTMTQYDKYGAAMATAAIAEKVEQWLKDNAENQKELEDAAEKQQEANELSQQAQDLADQIEQQLGDQPGGEEPGEGAGDSDEEGDGTGGEEGEDGAGGMSEEDAAAAQQALQQALEAAQAAQDAADQAMQQALQGLQQATSGAKQAVHEGVKQATEQLDAEAEAFAAWGMEPGQIRKMDYDERKKWAERLLGGKNMRDFHKLLGRWRMMEIAERSKRVQYGRDEIVGVEMSDDLSRVLDEEFATSRAHRMLRLDFLERFADEQLLSEEWVGVEKEGQGAIIALVDTSSSMDERDVAGATRIAWAKGLSLALQQRAAATKRDFVAILFGSPAWGGEPAQIKVFKFPGGRGPLEDVIAMVEFDWNGGTDFMAPMTVGMEILEAEYNSHGRMRGDILLITDGEAGVTPEWMEEYHSTKKRLGFRTFGVQVGHDSDIGRWGMESMNTLNALCDGKVTDIVELADCDPRVMASTLRNL